MFLARIPCDTLGDTKTDGETQKTMIDVHDPVPAGLWGFRSLMYDWSAP